MSTLTYALGTSIRARVLAHQQHFPVGYIFGIGIAEYLFAYHDVAFGVVICLGMVLVSYLLLSMVELDPLIARCIEAISLSPMYILFTASLPWFMLKEEYLLPGVYSVILALVFWHIYRQKYTSDELKGMGWRVIRPARQIIMGLTIAVPTGLVEFLILRPDPAAPSLAGPTLMRDAFYMFCFVAVAEEVLFRGLVQQSLMNAFGFWHGVIITSVLFAVMHMSWRSVPELGFVFLASMMLGYMRVRTKSLVGPLAWHGMNNTILVGVLPYLIRK
ncbi:MAG: CPBP family intramembrane metalloprotease [Dehalococcoidia bacterium]|nr:CPBP family intramembrane metalloprotease [Dehalococcoidia bacterium]